VVRENKQFSPTELGFVVVELLNEHFGDILDVEFTAKLEENLDAIEEGEAGWKQVIREFYVPFKEELDKAQDLIEKIEIKDEEAGRDCPQCGRPLFIKYGRFGKFLACSGFPECRYTESINEEIGVDCPFCGSPIIALKSKKGRKYFGCKAYPNAVSDPGTSHRRKNALIAAMHGGKDQPRQGSPNRCAKIRNAKRSNSRGRYGEKPVNVIGGGLAGVRSSQAVGRAGIPVKLWEMRPQIKTAVHRSENLARAGMQQFAEIKSG
jgi:ssDNA-binding Zn-finger/Zn-ribbon topoisomerase 1